jgi:hypothetical protein
VELPGRETRRTEPRYTRLRDAAAALFPVLAPVLNEPHVPYVMIGHSMGTWMLFETLKLIMSKGVAMPQQVGGGRDYLRCRRTRGKSTTPMINPALPTTLPPTVRDAAIAPAPAPQPCPRSFL